MEVIPLYNQMLDLIISGTMLNKRDQELSRSAVHICHENSQTFTNDCVDVKINAKYLPYNLSYPNLSNYVSQCY
jgi:hypothetical protein